MKVFSVICYVLGIFNLIGAFIIVFLGVLFGPEYNEIYVAAIFLFILAFIMLLFGILNSIYGKT